MEGIFGSTRHALVFALFSPEVPIRPIDHVASSRRREDTQYVIRTKKTLYEAIVALIVPSFPPHLYAHMGKGGG